MGALGPKVANISSTNLTVSIFRTYIRKKQHVHRTHYLLSLRKSSRFSIDALLISSSGASDLMSANT